MRPHVIARLSPLWAPMPSMPSMPSMQSSRVQHRPRHAVLSRRLKQEYGPNPVELAGVGDRPRGMTDRAHPAAATSTRGKMNPRARILRAAQPSDLLPNGGCGARTTLRLWSIRVDALAPGSGAQGDSNCFGGVPVGSGTDFCHAASDLDVWSLLRAAWAGDAFAAAESKTRVATPVETVRSTLATFAWRGEAVAMMRAMPGCRLWPGAMGVAQWLLKTIGSRRGSWFLALSRGRNLLAKSPEERYQRGVAFNERRLPHHRCLP